MCVCVCVYLYVSGTWFIFFAFVFTFAFVQARRNRESGQVCNAAVMVDPETNQVIAVGSDETLGWEHGNHRNPLRHAAMVACENVAKRILRLFPGAGTSRR